MSLYTQIIREELARQGAIGTDPRHVEGFMRIEYGTLDHLSNADFRRETKEALECIREGGIEPAENLAQSFGL